MSVPTENPCDPPKPSEPTPLPSQAIENYQSLKISTLQTSLKLNGATSNRLYCRKWTRIGSMNGIEVIVFGSCGKLSITLTQYRDAVSRD